MDRNTMIRLVTAAQRGDHGALNTLFNEFYQDVYYFALKTIQDEETACDITQDSFVDIINHIGELQEPAAFVKWMRQITYHQCTRYFKKKKDVLVEEDEDGNTIFDIVAEDRTEFIPDEALDQQDFRKTILAMLDELSEEQRAATVLYYYDELSVKQIAEIQGVSEGTVKSRLNYARKSIKNSVETYEKKNGIKLHSFAFLPFMLWLFNASAEESAAATCAAPAIAAGISTATGISVVSATSSAVASAAVAAGADAVAKSTLIPFVAKVIAAIIASVVIVGGAGIALHDTPSKNNTAPTTSSVAVTNPSSATIPTEPTSTLPIHIHDWKNATCTEPKTCKSCNAIEGSAIGHDWLAATCDDPKICRSCSATEDVALGHTYNSSVIPSTCRDQGYTTHICLRCDNSYVDTWVPVVQHSFENCVCKYCGLTVMAAGEYGDNLIWFLSESGTLTISGSGDMQDRQALVYSPWETYIDSIVHLVIEDGITSIGSYMFEDCSSLVSVSLPTGISRIGNSAFASCSSLSAITMPEGLTTIGARAFYRCTSLTNVVIPTGVTSVGGTAFEQCSNLASITLPDTLTSIGGRAFDKCTSLTNIVIPHGVTSIESGTFHGCKSLKEVIIPQSVTSIGTNAFYGCSSLSSIVIPDSVTSIGDFAFRGCGQMTSVTISANIASIGNLAFGDCNSLNSIRFSGTVAQWSTVDLKDGWNRSAPAKEVICADGTVALP